MQDQSLGQIAVDSMEEEMEDNPEEPDGDDPGGGGGATDIRTNKSRLIVAVGGSGVSWEDGNPGGDACGFTREGWNAPLKCSDTTNTHPTGSKRCVNPNGIGGTGYSDNTTPRSGGGGDSAVHQEFWAPFASDSGSSYVKKCTIDEYDAELCFFKVQMHSNNREGHGLLTLKRIWECADSNYLYCKNGADK